MKIKKIVSSIGTSAAAITLSALMLAFSAGAWDLYYSDYAGVDPSLPDRNDRVSAAAALYISNASSLFPMGENTILTPEMIDALNKQFDKLCTNNYSILDKTFPAIIMSIEHQIYDVPDVKYTVALTKDFLNANVGSTINLALEGGSYGSEGCLRLKNVSVGYNGSLYYSITSASAESLFESCGVKTNDKLLVYSLNNGQTSYTDIKNRPDANLTFAMSSADHTSTGLYITGYDSKSLEYFSKNELLPIIKAELLADLGFSESDLENQTVKEYIDYAAEQIRKLIIDDNGNARYASVDYVDKAVQDYYLAKVTVSGQTVFTAEALVHQRELAEALMQTKTAQDIITDSIYGAFGIDISERMADKLKEALWEDLVEKTVKEMNDYENGSSTQVANINYFLSRITGEEFKKLAEEIDEVKKRFKGTSSAEPTLAEILTTIDSYTDKLSDGVTTVTMTQILDFIKRTDAFLNGTNKTLDEVLNGLSDSLRQYADQTGSTAYSDSVKYTDQAKSDALTASQQYADQARTDAYTASQRYADQATADALTASQKYADQARADALTASQKYTDNQLLISNYELQRQLEDLKEQLEDIEYEIDDLRRERDYYYNNYYNTSDWIIRSYGSIDGFISAVANEAVNRINANGRTGESAYEIAVRNGFRGSEQEWLNSLVGASAYDIAVQNGYRGSQDEWLESLRGEDGRDGEDGQDGEDGRVIYIYGDQMQSAAPVFDDEDSEETDPDSVISGQVFGEDAELAEPDDSANGAYGTVSRNTAANIPVAGNTSAPPENKTANPKTGAAAGIIIPAAAIGSLFLIRKGKRKRGRR